MLQKVRYNAIFLFYKVRYKTQNLLQKVRYLHFDNKKGFLFAFPSDVSFFLVFLYFK